MKNAVNIQKSELGFLSLVVVLLSLTQTVENVFYVWNGECPVWGPYAPHTCWNPPGIPSTTDTIQVPTGKNLTLHCPSSFTGSSNSFNSAVYSYGPTCVYQIGSVLVSSNATFQVSTYLAATISLPSYIEEGANAVLWGSLAAIDGSGDLHVAGNLSVSGGNLQGNGSLIIEGTGVVSFEEYPIEPLDCYLLRPNILVNGTLLFQNPTYIGFWWQEYTGDFNFTIMGSIYFNTFYVFNMNEVNFNVQEGGMLYSNSMFPVTDIVYNSLINYGNLSSYFPVTEIENYGYIYYGGDFRYTGCNSALNYGEIEDLICGVVVNHGNLSALTAYNNVTNYGDIQGGTVDAYFFNYGTTNVYYIFSLYNYAKIAISTVYSLYNEGIVEYINSADYLYNYGLVKTETAYYSAIEVCYNYDIIYLTQDMSIMNLYDYNGVIYTDLANLEFQPAYWFWVKDYPQSLYPEVAPYGPEFNRPELFGYWSFTNFNSTSLSGTGSYQFNVPCNIIDNLFVDAAVNIEILAANYTDPYKNQYSFYVEGNITVSPDGLISAVANFFGSTRPETPYYLHVFGAVEMTFVFTNLTIVVHPLGTVDIPGFLHIMPSSHVNNSVEVFGDLTVEGIFNSDVNIILYKGGVLTLQANSILNLSDNVVIENCGGHVINNGGTLNGNSVPCSSPEFYHSESAINVFYSHFIDAVEFVKTRKEEIVHRLSKYDLKYHHSH